jgi:hypothetical protein
MKRPFFILFLLVPVLAFTQSVKLSSIFDVDIDNITLLQVVKGPSGYYGAKKGYKFLIIQGTFHSKAGRRTNMALYKMFIKTDANTYMALANPSYIPFSDLDRFIRFKTKAYKTIYFEVDEKFTEGILVFNQNTIGTIRVIDEDGSAEIVLPSKE